MSNTVKMISWTWIFLFVGILLLFLSESSCYVSGPNPILESSSTSPEDSTTESSSPATPFPSRRPPARPQEASRLIFTDHASSDNIHRRPSAKSDSRPIQYEGGIVYSKERYNGDSSAIVFPSDDDSDAPPFAHKVPPYPATTPDEVMPPRRKVQHVDEHRAPPNDPPNPVNRREVLSPSHTFQPTQDRRTPPDGAIVFEGPTSASQGSPSTSDELMSECECPVTPEFNPVCGEVGDRGERVTFSNFSQFNCAVKCSGTKVRLLFRSRCQLLVNKISTLPQYLKKPK